MKKLLFGVLTAFGVALGANAAETGAETTFETGDTTVSVQEDKSLLKTGTYWSVDGEEGTDVATTSKVTEYKDGEGVSKGNDYGEVGSNGMTYDPGKNYLTIDADKVLLRKNTATLSAETTSYYIDTMVKFTATDLDDDKMKDEIATGEKIVVWMYKGEADPAPVLKVAGGFVNSIVGGISVSKKTYTADGSYNEGTWYRLSVKAISAPFKDLSGGVSFVVCINGTPLTYVHYAIATSNISLVPKNEYSAFAYNLIPSRVQGADVTKLAGLGFKGNGAVDNILFSAAAPCNALKDGPKVVYYNVNGTKYVTFADALDAALKLDEPVIKLVDDLDFSTVTEFLSMDLTAANGKTVVLDLNGKEIPVLGDENNPISIEVSNGTIKIISSTGNAIVQGLVVANNSNVIIGDAVAGDQGVTYTYTHTDADTGTVTAMFDNTGSTIKLYKGNFVSDPREVGATVDEGYELVKSESMPGYYTIQKTPEPTTTSVTITLGTGIASATYQIGDAQAVKITEKTTIPNVEIGAVITVRGTAAEGYTAKTIDPVKVSAETTTIDVTATLNEYDLTVTVGNEGVDSVTVKVNGEIKQFTSGTPIKVSHGATVTIESAASEGYKLDGAETNTFTMTEAKSVSVTATQNSPTTGTLVISWTDENVKSVSYTIGNGDAQSATSGAEISVEVDKTVTITAVVADWYKADVSAASFVMTADGKTVTIAAMKIASGDISESTPAADAGITAGDFANATKAEVQNVVSWAQANNVSIADVNAMNFTTPGTKEEAYLLNCANTEAAVTGAKAAFQIPSIKVEGATVTVGVPTGNYNGTIKIKGKASLSDTEWTDKAEGHKFFRAFLTK